jgi:hypothetical protein
MRGVLVSAWVCCGCARDDILRFEWETLEAALVHDDQWYITLTTT